MAKPIDVALMRGLFNYDPETGQLTWRKPMARNVRPGDVAGWIKDKGHRCITIGNKSFMAHRVAWAIHYGADPGDMQIDHINANKADNRVANLRLATHSENKSNTNDGPRRDNILGVRGVHYDARRRKYVAQKTLRGRRVLRKQFNTLHEAAEAYEAAGRGVLPD